MPATPGAHVTSAERKEKQKLLGRLRCQCVWGDTRTGGGGGGCISVAWGHGKGQLQGAEHPSPRCALSPPVWQGQRLLLGAGGIITGQCPWAGSSQKSCSPAVGTRSAAEDVGSLSDVLQGAPSPLHLQVCRVFGEQGGAEGRWDEIQRRVKGDRGRKRRRLKRYSALGM